MRSLNYEANVDLSQVVKIFVGFWSGWRIKDFLPDKDFCVWKDFPFSQKILVHQWAYWRKNSKMSLKPNCLYLWLNQETDPLLVEKVSPPCDFEKLLSRCNKTKYHRDSFIWSVYDTKSISKRIQIVLSFSSYFIYVFGIITNSLLVYLIWSKKTRDAFKGLKHYPFLGAISIFNIIILFINSISWLSDCKDTLDLFCPQTRKYISVQFFKVKNF